MLVGCRTTEFTWIDRIDRRVLGFGGNFVLYWGYKKKFSSSWCVAGGDRCSLVKHLFQCVVCSLHLYVLRFACGLPLNQSSLLKVLHVL